MRIVPPLLSSVLVVAVGSIGACSEFSADPNGADAGSAESGAAFEDAPSDAGPPVDSAPGIDAAALEMNPYGLPYPTKYIGWDVRNGDTPGRVIANLKFPGYRVGGSALEAIPLALVYDPESRTHTTVVVILAGAWDFYSKDLLDRLRTDAPTRIAYVSVLIESSKRGEESTPLDLSAWRSRLPTAIHVLDPLRVKLRPVPITDDVVPLTVILDARTMEIVSAEAGSPINPTPVYTAARDAIEARLPAY